MHVSMCVGVCANAINGRLVSASPYLLIVLILKRKFRKLPWLRNCVWVCVAFLNAALLLELVFAMGKVKHTKYSLQQSAWCRCALLLD